MIRHKQITKLNPKLLEKHAPVAYKFYKGLDYELSTENKASPRAARKNVPVRAA